MRAGTLRHQITIQVDNGGKNSSGGWTEDWQTFAARQAGIRPLTGQERIEAAQTEAEVTHEVRLRYDSTTAGTKPSMRLLYGSRVFTIESVVNVNERNRELLLSCREAVS